MSYPLFSEKKNQIVLLVIGITGFCICKCTYDSYSETRHKIIYERRISQASSINVQNISPIELQMSNDEEDTRQDSSLNTKRYEQDNVTSDFNDGKGDVDTQLDEELTGDSCTRDGGGGSENNDSGVTLIFEEDNVKKVYYRKESTESNTPDDSGIKYDTNDSSKYNTTNSRKELRQSQGSP